ncbi:unnamed protein product [Linum tenue]|uniref:Major facilitator superfamily (MFS) profile domain-containing protein n=1 Tax=Linum tenue TaxID=586396 RepID=A0AAV0HEC4_9ROSI|nr:unnamed protein product [Linum tenue]
MVKKKEQEEISSQEDGRTQPLLPPSEDHDKEDLPFTPTLLLSILAAACGCLSTGCIVGYSSPVEYQIIEELGLSVQEYSFFGSMMIVGGLVGSIVGGKITEMMLGLGGLFIVGWLTIATAEGALQLDFGRLLLGIGSSITLYLAPVYVAEITPKNLRGAAVSVTQLTMVCSISFTFLVGSFINWRALALIGTIPGLVQLVLTFFIPESPRWLAKTGREKEFEAALLQLRGGNADISWEVDEIKEYTKIIHSISKDSSIFDLFQKQYAIPLIVGNGLMVLQQFSGLNSYTLYTGAIFVSAGLSLKSGSVIVTFIQLVGTVLTAALMDRYGRRPLLQAAVIGTCFGSLLTALSFILQIYSGSMSVGNGIPWIIVAEIFPLNIKGSAGTMCCLSYNVSSLMVSFSFQSLLQWSPPGTFLLYASASVVAIGFVAKLVPETRGRTLEEIQSSFTQK